MLEFTISILAFITLFGLALLYGWYKDKDKDKNN